MGTWKQTCEVMERNMKVKIEIDESLQEEEILIRCPALNDSVTEIYQELSRLEHSNQKLVLFQGNKEFYIPIQEILFFETTDCCICAHTANEMYQIKLRLYELEELLPGEFMRVSKSTILNLNHIYSITRNLTASSAVELLHSHKQVYVSRYYFKALKCRMDDKRSQM